MRRYTALIALLACSLLMLGADAPSDPLEQLAGKDVQVSLRFERQPLEKVLQAIGAAAGFRVQVDPGLTDVVVTVNAADVTVRKLLLDLSGEHDLELVAPSADRLEVRAAVRAAR